ncbi:MAG: aminotransferase class V-fold PLP-dependent enzyme [Cyclobacteriaceae bacterium]
MNDPIEFRKAAHELIDWIADYHENIDRYPVKSQVKPDEIKSKLPESAPADPVGFDNIMKDFEEIILPGITHWQNPRFHAYFPGNSSYPSLLGEMLTSAIAAQCMIWETSPAAAELEERVLDWLKEAMGLPINWKGVIQDTASTGTLAAILTAREQVSNYSINKAGFEHSNYRIYCSTETHSSIEKAVKIAGFGSKSVIQIPVDQNLQLDTSLLKEAISADLNNGLVPVCVVATLGTTGTCSIDPLKPISSICKKHNIWLHVDAAFAGTALLLEEHRGMISGLTDADSFLFNPHKWMFTNFDCTAYYVKDSDALVKTFELLPEYLKTKTHGLVNDYRDWGVPLGRRFRALKLWFVIRSYGLEGIKAKLREHIRLAELFEDWVNNSPDFEKVIQRSLCHVCFRFNPKEVNEERELENLNKKLLEDLNASGEMYLTHTKVNGKYCLRMVIAQTNVNEDHIKADWALINQLKPQV